MIIVLEAWFDGHVPRSCYREHQWDMERTSEAVEGVRGGEKGWEGVRGGERG